MEGAEQNKRSKGYPVKNYHNLVWKLKEDLAKFMTQNNVCL